jgi:protein gp37
MAKQGKGGISWTEFTWNLFVGCLLASAGCEHCYAAELALRLEAMGQDLYKGLAYRDENGDARWTGKIRLNPEALKIPYSMKPSTIFVGSMTDIFMAKIPREWQRLLFEVICNNPQHRYLLLTKRPALAGNVLRELGIAPMENVLIGFSAEDQKNFDARAPFAKQLHDMGWRTWVSIEPQLDAIKLGEAAEWLEWVVVGGESTRRARKVARRFDFEWARSLLAECRRGGAAFHMKQGGHQPFNLGKPMKMDGQGHDMEQFPEGLRIREFPEN